MANCPHYIRRWGAVYHKDIRVPELSEKAHEANAAGILACLYSHVGLIKHARKRKDNYVCIYEDDVIWCDGFEERIRYVESTGLDFDMFYLGGHFDNDEDAEPTEYRHIYKIKNVGGTYAYIIRKSVYNFVIDNITYNWGIDQFYGAVVQHRFNCYAMLPFMIGTVPGYSDVAMHYADYTGVNKRFLKERIDGL